MIYHGNIVKVLNSNPNSILIEGEFKHTREGEK